MIINDLKLWVDLGSVVMEIFLLAYLMHILLGPMRCAWYSGAAVYLLLGGCLWGISYGIGQAYLRTLLYMVLIPLATVICYRGVIWTKAFAGFCYIVMAVMLEYIVHNGLMLVFKAVYATGRNNMQDYVLGVALSKILMLMLTQALAQWLKHTRRQKGQLSLQNFCLLLFFPLTTMLALFIIYYSVVTSGDVGGIFYLLVITILFFLADVALFVLFKRLLEAAYLEQEHRLAQQQYYRTLVEKNASLGKWSHEVKNALVVIRAYIQTGELEKATAYIDQTSGKVDGAIENLTDNIALDAVLGHKKQMAQAMGVELKYRVALNDSIGIEIMDLVVVLANGLDNALEAVAKLPDPLGSVITCELTLQKDWLKIVICNPVRQTVKIGSADLLTDKGDTLRHGIGLTNVRDIVKGHNGELKLSCEDQQFIFTALMANK